MRVRRVGVRWLLSLWLALACAGAEAEECGTLRLVMPELDAFPLYAYSPHDDAHTGALIALTRVLAQRVGCAIQLSTLAPIRARQAVISGDADISWAFEQMAAQAPPVMFPQTASGQIDFNQTLAIPMYIYARRADVENPAGDARQWAQRRTVGMPFGVLLAEHLRADGIRTDTSAPKRAQMVRQLLAGRLDALAVVDPTLAQRLPVEIGEQIVRFRQPIYTSRMFMILSPQFTGKHPVIARGLRQQFARDGNERFDGFVKQLTSGALPAMRLDE